MTKSQQQTISRQEQYYPSLEMKAEIDGYIAEENKRRKMNGLPATSKSKLVVGLLKDFFKKR